MWGIKFCEPIVAMMRDGWELKSDQTITKRPWLQKDTKVKSVSFEDFGYLVRNQLISTKSKIPGMTVYQLTQRAK